MKRHNLVSNLEEYKDMTFAQTHLILDYYFQQLDAEAKAVKSGRR